jgi:hypothetical protein
MSRAARRQPLAWRRGTTLVVGALAAAAMALPAAAAGPDAPLALVRSLYDSERWITRDAPPPRGAQALADAPSARQAAWLDAELVALLAREQRCQRRGQGDCALDFLPLWDSQDAVGATVQLRAGAQPQQVLATLQWPPAAARAPLVFELRQGAEGWRVADIRYPGQRPSLKALLQRTHGKPGAR